MWRYILILSLVTIFNCSSKIEYGQNDLKWEKVFGNVKSIEIRTFDAIEAFGNIEKGNLSHLYYDNKLTYFDRSGEKEKIIVYNTDNTLREIWNFKKEDSKKLIETRDANGDIIRSTIHLYNNYGDVISSKTFNSKGEVTSTSNSTFDEFHKHLYSEVRNSENFLEMKISNYYKDSKLYRAESIIYKENNLIDFRWVREYNSNEINYLTITYNGDGNPISIQKNDSNGNPIEEKHPNNNQLDVTIYTYDRKGNLTSEVQYNSNGEVTSKTNFKYKYDNFDNWIYKLELRDNEPYQIQERIISYFS